MAIIVHSNIKEAELCLLSCFIFYFYFPAYTTPMKVFKTNSGSDHVSEPSVKAP